MKTFSFKKFFAFVFCSIIFTSAIVAQEKPRALDMGEFSDENIQRIKEKIVEFSKRLAKEPVMTKGFIHIEAKKELFEKVKSIISEVNSDERILFEGKLDGTKSITLYFILIPSGADIPAFCGLQQCVCPTLSVSGDSVNAQNSLAFIFKANIGGGDEENVITYGWKVSAGRIVEGQGTPTIKVFAEGAKEITATVEIGGVCEECLREATFTTEISLKPELIESFGREIFDISQGRLDNFIAFLQNNPTAQGYVINYIGRFENKRAFAKRIEQIKTYFKFRSDDINTNRYYVDTNRITFVNGGYRENIETELWLSFDDNQKPVPTPTVDKRFVTMSKPTKKNLLRIVE